MSKFEEISRGLEEQRKWFRRELTSNQTAVLVDLLTLGAAAPLALQTAFDDVLQMVVEDREVTQREHERPCESAGGLAAAQQRSRDLDHQVSDLRIRKVMLKQAAFTDRLNQQSHDVVTSVNFLQSKLLLATVGEWAIELHRLAHLHQARKESMQIDVLLRVLGGMLAGSVDQVLELVRALVGNPPANLKDVAHIERYAYCSVAALCVAESLLSAGRRLRLSDDEILGRVNERIRVAAAVPAPAADEIQD